MKNVLKKWFKQNVIWIVVLFVLVFLNMYLMTFPSKYIGEIVDLFSDKIVNNDEIIKKIISLFAISGIIFLVRIPWKAICSQTVMRYEKILKDSLFEHFMKCKLEDLQNIKNGEIMAYFTKDNKETRRLFYGIFSMGTRCIATIVIAAYTMKNVNTKLTIVTLIPLIFFAIIILAIKNLMYKFSMEYREKFLRVSEYVQESSDGIRTIKAYACEDSQIEEFEKRNNLLRKCGVKGSIIYGLNHTLVSLGFGICEGIVLLYGSHLVENNTITLGDLIAFNGYLLLLVNPIQWIPMLLTRYKNAAISFERLFQVFDLPEEDLNLKKIHKGNVKGDIEIKNLTYNYPANIEVALKNINLNIKEGSTLGIIGTIGSGKTTLMNLLLRLYNVSDGHIKIGDKDINEISLNELRNSICYITQDHFLFSTSIKENIGLFRDEFSEEEILDSTKSAMIADDISKMNDGINTVVGERGIDLSGGQKQRVVISRAFLQKSNIVIFDDTFSALDNRTEAFLLNNIKELTKGKTCIIISNRISDIKDADDIIVLDDGEIVEHGTHQELSNGTGLYNKFYKQQTSKVDEEVGDLIG